MKYIEYNQNLCFKCLKEHNDIKIYSLAWRGYGSNYDSFNSNLQLCPHCRKEIDEDLDKWFNESPNCNEYWEDYQYEDNISEYIKSLPIQGQELFENQISYGACAYTIESQDWIDMELGVAEHEVYKNYGMTSPSELEVYNKRFPTCARVFVKKYADGSGDRRCNFGAYEDFGKSSCYHCRYYEHKDIDHIEVVKEDLLIEPKVVKLVEIICPKCNNIEHIDYSSVVYDHQEYHICSVCHQELVWDAEKIK